MARPIKGHTAADYARRQAKRDADKARKQARRDAYDTHAASRRAAARALTDYISLHGDPTIVIYNKLLPFEERRDLAMKLGLKLPSVFE